MQFQPEVVRESVTAARILIVIPKIFYHLIFDNF